MGRNMKNKSFGFIAKLLVVLAGIFMFASFSPSLDGRAVVVDEGVFPPGLFAKTVGYLPGDIISVANVAGNKNVDLLVIGALDPSEGVAIMLSPEAAKAVGIEKDSNSIVKITKRNGQDDRVYGNAVISSGDVIPTEKYVQDNSDADKVEESPFEEEILPVIQEQKETKQEVKEDTVEQAPIEKTEIVPEESKEAEVTENKNEETPVVPEVIYKEEKDAETKEEIEEAISETPFEEEETVFGDEKNDDFVTSKEYEDQMIEQLRKEETAFVPVNQNQNVVEEEVSETPFREETENETDEDAYEAIVLVPSTANPPAVEKAYKTDVASEEKETAYVNSQVAALEDTEESSEDENEDKINYLDDEDEVVVVEDTEDSSEKVIVEEKTSKADSFEKYLVESSKDLKRGKYYIQIAVMKETSNIMELIKKYGKNYPITIVPTSNGSAYQVLIGSLSMDEYAVVLERFKSYGYKDAFLRKIK